MATPKDGPLDPAEERRLVDLIRRGGEIPDEDIRAIVRLGDRTPERDKACSAALLGVQSVEERRMAALRANEREAAEAQKKLAGARAGLENAAFCRDWLNTRIPREFLLEIDTCGVELRQHEGRRKDAQMRLSEEAARLQEVQDLRKRGKAEQDQLDEAKKTWEAARARLKGIEEDIENAQKNLRDAKARSQGAIEQFRKKALSPQGVTG